MSEEKKKEEPLISADLIVSASASIEHLMKHIHKAGMVIAVLSRLASQPFEKELAKRTLEKFKRELKEVSEVELPRLFELIEKADLKSVEDKFHSGPDEE